MNKLFQFFAGSKDKAVGDLQPVNSDYDLMLAIAKTKKFLSSNGDSLSDICLAVECAESKSALEAALIPFNRIMRIFRIAVPDPKPKNLIVDALANLNCSKRLINYLQSAINVHDGLLSYKTAVVKKLKIDLARMKDLRRSDNAFDESLLTSHLTERIPTHKDSGCTIETKYKQNAVLLTRSPSQKRTISLDLARKNENKSKDDTMVRSGLHKHIYEDHPNPHKRVRRDYSDRRRRTKAIAGKEDRDKKFHENKNDNYKSRQKCKKKHFN